MTRTINNNNNYCYYFCALHTLRLRRQVLTVHIHSFSRGFAANPWWVQVTRPPARQVFALSSSPDRRWSLTARNALLTDFSSFDSAVKVDKRPSCRCQRSSKCTPHETILQHQSHFSQVAGQPWRCSQTFVRSSRRQRRQAGNIEPFMIMR